jgi:hypothetical protein
VTDSNTRTQHSGPASLWVAWIIAGIAVALCFFVFMLWGINGPIYLFDLIAAYCGF